MRKRKPKPNGQETASTGSLPGLEEISDEAPAWAVEGARLLQDLENAYRLGNMDEVEALMARVVALSDEHGDEMDNPQSPFLAKSLACQTEGDWDGAETALRHALAAADDAMSEWYANNELVALYRTLDRHEDALAASRAAVEAIRKDDRPVLLFASLDSFAICAIAAKEPELALPALEEALALGAEDAEPSQIGGMISTRARARLAMGDIEGAQADMANAWEHMEGRDVTSVPPSSLSALCRCWAAEARVRAALEDYDGLLEARWAALDCMEAVADNPLSASILSWKLVADACKALGEAQAIVGDLEAAKATFEEARILYNEIGVPIPQG